MVTLKEHKHFTEGSALEYPAPPKTVYIPLAQHVGKPCSLVGVAAGDAVLKGKRLAGSDGKVWSPVHASISGRVKEIKEWFHPSLSSAPAIVIEGDGANDTAEAFTERSRQAVNKLSPEQIRKLVFEAGVVGMGGAGFPAHIKLDPPGRIHTCIINIAECEPYLTGDSQLTVQKTHEIVLGIGLVQRCVNPKHVIIAIEENKPEAIRALETFKEKNFSLRVLRSSYPQGGEKQLIKNLLGREVPSGKLPFDVGVTVHNVSTVNAIYEAVYKGKPLYERVVTVTGTPLTDPKNIMARIGTPIKELIDLCGPLKEKYAKIIIGGPMMGVSQFTDQVPVIKTTTGIVLLTRNEAKAMEERACIRCGSCIRECPMGLMPCLLSLYAEREQWEQAKQAGVLDCIECGSCSYLCPSRRRIVQAIKRVKLEAMKK